MVARDAADHVLGQRSTALLREAAAALDDGRDPFSTEFLLKHGVKFDECQSLSQHIAIAIRAFLVQPKHLQMQSLLHGLIDGNDPTETALLMAAGQIASEQTRMEDAMDGLEALGQERRSDG